MESLIAIGGFIVMIIVLALIWIFAKIVLLPTLIFAAIGAFVGYMIDNALGSGTCFATVGAILGGLFGLVGGLKVLGGGG